MKKKYVPYIVVALVATAIILGFRGFGRQEAADQDSGKRLGEVSSLKRPSSDDPPPPDSVPELSPAEIAGLGIEAFDDSDISKRVVAFDKLIEGLTAENALQIMAELERRGISDHRWKRFLEAWAGKDGAGAIAYTESLGREVERFELQQVMLPAWCKKDPEAATAWIKSIGDRGFETEFIDADRANSSDALMRGLLALERRPGSFTYRPSGAEPAIDPAVEALFNLYPNREPDGLEPANGPFFMAHIARAKLTTGGLAGTISWLDGLPAGALKDSAAQIVAAKYSSHDPGRAAAWAEGYRGSELGTNLIGPISKVWAKRDPAAAASWLESQPESETRKDTTVEVVNDWIRQDPMAGSQYLRDLPPSETKDATVSRFAQTLVSSDPEAAIAWAESISDPDLRESTLIASGQEWHGRNREAAEEWLSESDLPDEIRQKITSHPGGVPAPGQL